MDKAELEQELFEVKSIKQAYDLIEKGTAQRITKKTSKNDTSSRSHLIFKIFIR